MPIRRVCILALAFCALLWPTEYSIYRFAGNDPENVAATSISLPRVISVAAGLNGSFFFITRGFGLYQVSGAGILTRIPFASVESANGLKLAVAPNGDLFILVVTDTARIYQLTGGTGPARLIAGGGASRTDGLALDADLESYVDMAATNSGLFLSDRRAVRKITSDGRITTLYTLPSPFLASPIPIAADPIGNVYFYDSTRVFKRDPAGVVSAFAGGGNDPNGENIPATASALLIFGMGVDAKGNLYVMTLDRVRMIDAATGLVRTIAGKSGEYEPAGPDGPVSNVRLYALPMAVDGSGAVYYYDESIHRIRKINNNLVNTVAGGGSRGDGGPAKDAQIIEPTSVAISRLGEMYIATPFYSEIRKVVLASGLVTTIYRQESTVRFDDSAPSKVVIGPNETLYFGGRSKIFKYANGSSFLLAGGGTFTGELSTGMLATDLDLQLGAFAVAANGEIYFTAVNRPGLYRISQDGRITVLSTTNFSAASLTFEKSGTLLIGSHNGGVFRFDLSNNSFAHFLNLPVDALAVDAAGMIYRSSYYRYISRLDPSFSNSTSVAGGGSNSLPTDGSPAVNASLQFVSGIAIDGQGDIYLSDQYKSRVWRVTPRVQIVTVGLPNAQTGEPYSYTLLAEDGKLPYQWAVAGVLPVGMKLDPTTGKLAGVALSTGLHQFTIQVTDASGITVARDYVLLVQQQIWPKVLTISPYEGAGTAQQFTTTITTSQTDPFDMVSFFIGDSVSSGASGCLIIYKDSVLMMGAPSGNGLVTPVNNMLTDGRCSLDLAASSASVINSATDRTTTIKLSVRAVNGFVGLKKVFVWPSGARGGGWTQRATWNIPAAPRSEPLVQGLAPRNGQGASVVVTARFGHSVSVSNLYLAYILLLPTPNIVQYTAAGSCLVEYNRISHAMRLINEAGDNWLGPISGVPLSQGGTLANSRCTLNIGESAALINGTELIVNASVTLKSMFTGTLGTFLQAQDVNGIWTGMTQFGNWLGAPQIVPKPGPYVVDVTPTNAAGPATYTLQVGHTAGADKLGMVHLRFNTSIVGGAPCHVVYFPASNTLNLINDEETALVLPNGVPLSESLFGSSRCAVDVGGTRTISGNILKVTIPMRFFSPAFSGAKSVYVNAFDIFGNLTHWVQTGTLNVP